ncbi:MAG: serine protease [Actinobacteria bacterium]|nr:serine protease [Actinomycetota bacterium]
MRVLQEVTEAVRETADAVGPAVVGIGRGFGRGTGVVIADGQVVTNAHNLRGDEVAVVFGDGRVAEGEVAGVDRDGDLAVIAADTGGTTPVEIGRAGELGPGSVVFALANPGGRGLRTTVGLVSATERSFRGPRGRRFRGGIEHTAPLPRGSSGGPLVDSGGRLVGINTVRGGGGLIVALAADDDFEERVNALARGEAVSRPRLGLAIAPARVARRLRRAVGLPERDGLLVHAVDPGGPAAAAGVEQGDLLVSAGGRDLVRVDDLHAAISDANGELRLTAVRGVEEREVVVSIEPIEPSGADR